jgi:hypothetical protein
MAQAAIHSSASPLRVWQVDGCTAESRPPRRPVYVGVINRNARTEHFSSALVSESGRWRRPALGADLEWIVGRGRAECLGWRV